MIILMNDFFACPRANMCFRLTSVFIPLTPVDSRLDLFIYCVAIVYFKKKARTSPQTIQWLKKLNEFAIYNNNNNKSSGYPNGKKNMVKCPLIMSIISGYSKFHSMFPIFPKSIMCTKKIVLNSPITTKSTCGIAGAGVCEASTS